MRSASIRRYLLAGLVVWLPILITIGVLRFIIDILDQTLALLPAAYQPEHVLGHHIPGFGVVLSLLLLLTTGVFASNFFGQRLVIWGESILARIPLVRSIYNAVKQILNTLLSTNSEAFRKVLIIEYPRKGLWTLAFQTGSDNKEVNTKLGEEMVSLYVPTTPNPTSGFLMMIPKKDVIESDMTIDEALKFIISLGVMPPNTGANFASTQKNIK